MMFCVELTCTRPAVGRVILDDIAGSIDYPGQCREHLLVDRATLKAKYISSLVTIAWASCTRCGGEGSIDGVPCGDCDDLTDQGGPLRFGDILRNDRETAIYLAPGRSASWLAVWPLFETSLISLSDRWEVSAAIWIREQGATP